MQEHKIRAIKLGLKLYYMDTDSLVLNGKLPSEMVHPTELGKFKLEHEIKHGIFITGKTYCLLLHNGDFIKRAKGVDPSSLTYDNYIELGVGLSIMSSKTASIKDYSKGSVSIENQNILLSSDVYDKRIKIPNTLSYYTIYGYDMHSILLYLSIYYNI